ncbi:MAG: succinic semialdehyde dehydrogenase [Phototrophicaceae bacterium]
MSSTKQAKGAPVAEGDGIAVTNPVTGEVIATVANTSREDVAAAVERAREAQRIWGELTVHERTRYVRRWGDLLWQDRDNAICTIRQETGKNDSGALAEILLVDSSLNYYVQHAERLLSPQNRPAAIPAIMRGRLYYKPYGVAGFISPWNYPFLLAVTDAIPALIAGNTVVIKPSDITPLSALYAADLFQRVGLPPDVLQIVTGDGETGAALVDYVDTISFTGSTAVGRKVAARAGERLIPCTLELGGKDAMIVLADADLDLAAATVFTGGLENAGQACVSIERVYVEAPIYDRFVERVRVLSVDFNVGNHGGLDVHMGSLNNLRELERAETFVQDALEKGAQLIAGGQRRPDLGPLFYEPAILANVNHEMRVMNEETFGPVMPIMKVADAAEAVRLANASEYGLSGAIYSRNLDRAEQLARSLNTGDVTVNRTNAVAGSPALPWGGQKHSGLGRRGGPEGLLRFVSTQSIVVDTMVGSKPSLIPLDPLTLGLLKGLHWVRRFVPFI